MKFKVGDLVEIINDGESYTTIGLYYANLSPDILTNYFPCEGRSLSTGETARVIQISESSCHVGIRKNGEDYVIGKEGLRLVTSTKGIMGTLKTLTTFIKTNVKQPQKNYYKLGWIEIKNDDLVVTEAGQTAFIQNQMIGDGDLEKFAAAEVARLKKEEKDE